MKYLVFLPAVLFLLKSSFAQETNHPLPQKVTNTTGQQAAPWDQLKQPVYVSFAASSTRFDKDTPPPVAMRNQWAVSGWKGEKLHTQVLVWVTRPVSRVSIEKVDLKDKRGNTISKQNITTGFVQYVMTDEFKNGCGYRKPANFDSSLVADLIQTGLPAVDLTAQSVQPVWVSISVPATAAAGLYTGTITVVADKRYNLQVSLNVINRILPAPAQWAYQLDLWQHPAAIARIHQLPLWSDAHFTRMKAYYTMLAAAGQKNITASIVNEPWGHQTYDDFPSLIKWTKKKDGQWNFDYSLFDKYVSFVMDCGIKNRINCYSMVPWKIAFTYYDEATGKDTVFTQAIGTPAYNEFWTVMLKDFTRHLKQKNWFAITAIAMDERPLDAMKSVIALLKTIDKDWKIALAGNYHGEIEQDITDYCIAFKQEFPAPVLARRQSEGKISTWYTCCVENYPNGFTFSPPDEHVWMGWYTAASNMDGYLRWAFNSWTKEPLKDSRFTAWPGGDTYQVYPGPFSSIRFEKLIEGIQDHEKFNY
ncbi:DUF4091 domain-containing protein [Paraflavitalea speifideaquila]|uniref:DUF4091 domain-containing protein n=1 Tax=Paraflavitalea speifideaquila TaxID=3076558 RepID=UPI0028EAB8E7|nr:glycoside hydrolase domain-containing protein [Paraflavitalea speifideiaquila]